MTTKQTAREHKAADVRCEREWECQCGACNIERRKATPAASASRHDRTPGPWKLDPVWNLILGQDGQEICAIHASSEPPRVGRSEAAGNAALIESAPQLAAEIAALRGLVTQLVRAVDCHELQLNQYHVPACQTSSLLAAARAALAGKAAAFGPWTLADSQTYAAKVAAGKAVTPCN